MPSMLSMGLKLAFFGVREATKAARESVKPSIVLGDVAKAELHGHSEFYTLNGEKVEFVVINGQRFLTHIFKNGVEIWNCYGLDQIGAAAFKAICKIIGG